jgi:YD repeat-containing protein
LTTSIQYQNVTISFPCSSGTCTQTEYWGYEDGSIPNMGAHLTSSFEGGIVTGQEYSQPVGGNYISENDFSVVDPSGTTHGLETDVSSWNTYRASDGSGYTFIPSGSLDAYKPIEIAPVNGMGWLQLSQAQIWLQNASDWTGTLSGVRLGTLYSPTGIQYTDTIQTFPQVNQSNTSEANGTGVPSYTPQALISTETDPSGNKITRGPWYWSGYNSVPNTPLGDIQTMYAQNSPLFLPGYHGPYYQDSVGRIIPDAISMQATQYTWTGPHGGAPTLTWTVPGPENNYKTYLITYNTIANTQSWSPPPNETLGEEVPFPDPTTDIEVQGWAIASIALPNNTQWTFTYNGADLQTVTTPSGGTTTYSYTTITPQSSLGLGRCNSVCHAVAQRTETDGQGHSWTTQYSYTHPLPTDLPALACPTVMAGGVPVVFAFTTTETDPLNNDTVHSFCAVGITRGTEPVANQYHEVETQYYQGSASGSIPLRTVKTAFEYQNDIAHSASSSTAGHVGIINLLPTNIATTTPAGTTTDVRQYSNDNGKALFTAGRIVCNWSGGCSTLGSNSLGLQTIPISYLSPTTEIAKDAYNNSVRTTSTTFMFQNPPSIYTSAHMDALPISQTVSDSSGGAGTVSGTNGFRYDEANGSPQGTYGNLTSKSETYYLSGSSSSGTSTTTHTVYNSQGMPTAKIDGNGNTTAITYDSTGLFPNRIQHPTTNGVPHIDNYSHDTNTGNLNSHTDENNKTTGYSYDVLGRVTSIQYPDGGGSTFCYTDIGGSICPQGTAPFSLYTSTIASPDPPITTTHTYDGWGRQYRSSITSDPLGATIVGTTYDWEGRVTSVSNPYRSTPAPNDPPSGITSYVYDALGRKTIQTQPDGSKQQWCYDGIVTTGQTNCSSMAESSGGFTPASWTDVSDETGRHTQQVFDALGHMGAVVEPDPASGNLALETDYNYDVFGDLFTVNQGTGGSARTQRMFYYDMPSRVSMACNPETLGPDQDCNMSSTGTWYYYDPNSNLTSKTDNRSITTSYTYDALNRLLSKRYSNDPSGTASSCYQYDGATAQNLSGRLAAQWTQKGACLSSSPVQTKTAITGYDAMGRLQSEQRCMGANCSTGNYTMSYTYDLAGKLLTYPSGYGNLNFTNNYDPAGRLSTVTQGANQPLFWLPSYTPAGALSGVQLGTSISMSRTFDSRQRVTNETDSNPTQ